uniref:Uncharacterized protein n=1 Tax=Plectus sambesii TaxID=2011161 RepID=A0A914V1Q4_9BILA
MSLLQLLLFAFGLLRGCSANADAKRLFEDLLSDYNKLIRPVGNSSAVLDVKFKMRLSQLLDVHEKNQIMTTNSWLEHEWYDMRMSWNPLDYGNVTVLYVPGEMIWLPDIVLYNNADGNYQVTIMTKATVSFTGKVNWDPPVIYKSMCQINVQWFPFDEQTCDMKFGSWTYDGLQVELAHKSDEKIFRYERNAIAVECVENGIDLHDYYPSTEWDIIAAPGWKKKEIYPCCPTPYIDITYKLFLRRKTLFYTVNLILPCVGISLLTVLVFYLPSDSGEKVTLSISILISLTVFFLLLVEMIPSTSLVVPLIGKYLLFTMIMVTLSICVTVVVINIHFRSPCTHKMSSWVRRLLIELLPKYMCMERPKMMKTWRHPDAFYGDQMGMTYENDAAEPNAGGRMRLASGVSSLDENLCLNNDFDNLTNYIPAPSPPIARHRCPKCLRWEKDAEKTDTRSQTLKALDAVKFIAAHLKEKDMDLRIVEEWKFAAMVIDRLFLLLFFITCFIGTATIILRAPSLYDERVPVDTGNQSVQHALNKMSYCQDMQQ